jgi:hypothetical protein
MMAPQYKQIGRMKQRGLQRGGTGLVAGSPVESPPSVSSVRSAPPVKSDPQPFGNEPKVGGMGGSAVAPAPATPTGQPTQSPSGLTPVRPTPMTVLPGATTGSPAPTLPSQQQAQPSVSPTGESDYYRLGHGFLEDYDKSQQGYNRDLYRNAGQALSRAGIGGSGMAADQINQVTQDIDENRLKFAYGATQDERQFRLQKAMLEDALANSAFGRDATRAQFAGGYNPSFLMGASDRQGEQAQDHFGALSELIQKMIASRGQPQAAGSPLPPRQPEMTPDIRK